MTLTTQDLRDAMDAYIDEVRVPNSEAMLAGVRDRVRADRRRGRTRLVAAVAAGVLAVGAAVGVNHVWPEQTLTPAEQVKKAGAHLPLFVGGYRLIGVQEVATHSGDPHEQAPTASMITDLRARTSAGAFAVFSCDDMLTTGTGTIDTAMLVTGDGAGRTGCYSADEPELQQPAFGPVVSSLELSTSRVGLISPDGKIRAKVPVGIYVPAKWGTFPTPTTTVNVEEQPPPTPSADVITANGHGNAAGTTSVTITPQTSGKLSLFVNLTSGSVGQFRARVDGADTIAGVPAAATDGWSPVWKPGLTIVFGKTVDAKAGVPIKVVVDAKDNRGNWVVEVAVMPGSAAPTSTTTP